MRALWILGALTLVVTAVNVWIFAHLQDGFIYEYASYSSLYFPSDRASIRQFFEPTPGTLEVALVGAGSAPWRVRSDTGVEKLIAEGPPVLELESGLHRYEILANTATSSRAAVRLGVWFTSSDALRRAGQSSPGNIHVFESSVPMGRFQQYAVRELVRDPASIPEARARAIRERLVSEAGLELEGSVEKKLEALGAFLVRRLAGAHGTPSDAMNALDGDQQFEAAVSGKGKVYCKNFAEIHQFHAASVGLASRRLSLFGKLGVAQLSAHALTEVWVPERGEWAAVDLVPKIFYVKNSEGRFMNVADLFHAHVSRAYGGLFATVLGDDDAIHVVPYAEVAAVHQLYFSRDAVLVYYFDGADPRRAGLASKLRRYALQPDLAYALGASNTRHVVKMAAFWSEPLLALGWLYVLTARFRRRTRTGHVAEGASER